MNEKEMKHERALLSDYTVLDLTDEKGQLCTKILADLGAGVIKVEPPGGDPARHIGPFAGDKPDPEKGLFWLAMNTGKKSVIIDLKTAAGKDRFRQLAKNADMIVESFSPGYLESLGLGYSSLAKENPRLIMTAITPFGQTGPYSHFAGPDLICMAMSGEMNLCGSPDDRPLRISVPQAYFHASLEAAVGSLFALWNRHNTGKGQFVDVSAQEIVAWEGFYNQCLWYTSRVNIKREGNHLNYGKNERLRVIYRCKDGHIIVSSTGGRLGAQGQKALVDWIDSEGMADDYLRNFDWLAFSPENRDEKTAKQLEIRLAPFYKTKTKNELFERAIRDQFLLGPVYTTKDITQSELFKQSGFWANVENPELGRTVPHPGPPYRSSLPNYAIRGPAPRLGRHTETIIGSETERSAPRPLVRDSGTDTLREPNGHIFDGLKILDFTWVIAGPSAVRYLADYGAEVIHAESKTRVDLSRQTAPFKDEIPGVDRSAYFAGYNSNKKGITLDLKTPSGLNLAKKLVAWADVVVDNFAPRVMDKLGLGYEVLRSIKPDIIMASTSLLGRNGPPFRGFGSQGAAITGLWSVTGYPDGEPTGLFSAYCDFIANRYLIIAILMALEEKRQTGRGQQIDQSQVECSLHFMEPTLLDFALNGRVARPQGNRDPMAAPHNAYQCRGDDRWCAIAVFAEDQWKALKQVMGRPAWADESRFSTLAGRKANEDELDRLMDEWTSRYDPHDLMIMLQKAGVPAGVVALAEDLHNDPQLAHRGHYMIVDHPVVGNYSADSPAFRFSDAEPRKPFPSPCLGEHNEYVVKEILNLSHRQWTELQAAGAFGSSEDL
ncbi:CaiB/BaiF CoA transferase family protein [Thermodesulfobacteriota bacterium]